VTNASRVDALFKLQHESFLTAMPLSTISASRPALSNRTNVYTNNTPSPWTVLQQTGTKRPSSGAENGGLKKRIKVNSKDEQEVQENILEDGDSDAESDSDEEMEDIVNIRARARRGTAFQMMNAAAMGLPRSRQGLCKSSKCFAVSCALTV
jgi:hypothetical protein